MTLTTELKIQNAQREIMLLESYELEIKNMAQGLGKEIYKQTERNLKEKIGEQHKDLEETAVQSRANTPDLENSENKELEFCLDSEKEI